MREGLVLESSIDHNETRGLVEVHTDVVSLICGHAVGHVGEVGEDDSFLGFDVVDVGSGSIDLCCRRGPFAILHAVLTWGGINHCEGEVTIEIRPR